VDRAKRKRRSVGHEEHGSYVYGRDDQDILEPNAGDEADIGAPEPGIEYMDLVWLGGRICYRCGMPRL